jgi:hypothetical protein
MYIVVRLVEILEQVKEHLHDSKFSKDNSDCTRHS